MVRKLFAGRPPTNQDVLLDAGTGDGRFLAGVIRHCDAHRLKPPRMVGIEADERRLQEVPRAVARHPRVRLVHSDYLFEFDEPADFVIGNPPYVSLAALSEAERRRCRSRFKAARGRFDLYMLFMERSLELLRDGGRMALVTPEKFQYVAAAGPLRRLLTSQDLEEFHFLDEATFPGLVTYPVITVLNRSSPRPDGSRVVRRDGMTSKLVLPQDGQPFVLARPPQFEGGATIPLERLCERISCGVATGADAAFVQRDAGLPEPLARFAYPTVAGRALTPAGVPSPPTGQVLLAPYDRRGRLLTESAAAPLLRYLRSSGHAARLKERFCVRTGAKPWYAFHDNFPTRQLLRPKLLCKDITPDPYFVVDFSGTVVPRHSVYYLVPRRGIRLKRLAAYLNSEDARNWLRAHCQRAANGFYRLQSSTLKRLPVPESVIAECAAPHAAGPAMGSTAGG